jgi:cell division ATPase FtsA
LLAGGLVITGGGAELMGIEQIFAKILKIPITRTVPRLTDRVINAFPNLAMNEQQVCRHAKYATLVGLMCQFLDESADDQIIGKSRWGGRYFGSLISWLREMS